MKQEQGKRFSKGVLVAVGIAGLVGGGAVAGVVTHQIMAQRVVMIDEDGNRWEGFLTPTPEGASGQFITDDGTVYGIEMEQAGAQKNVTVDVSGAAAGGASTVILEETDATRPELEIEGDGGN